MAPYVYDPGAVLIQLQPQGDPLTEPVPLRQLLRTGDLPEDLARSVAAPLLDRRARRRLSTLVARARHCDRDFRAPRLDRLAVVDATESIEPMDLASRLDRSSEVAYAVAAPPPAASPGPIQVPAALDWLTAAPRGVGAEPVWSTPATENLTGVGAVIRIVERGVRVDRLGGCEHPDIDAERARLATSHPAFRARNASCTQTELDHGIRTLGILMAGIDPVQKRMRRDQLPLGLVPECDSVTVYPIGHVAQTMRQDVEHTADALVAALHDSAPGDVLLLEAQANTRAGSLWVPLEVLRPWFDVIRLATALGIVVIEPAGNGHHDLDKLPVGSGTVDLRTEDSGAILVAMGGRSPRGGWYATGSRGRRVDCFGPDRNVITTAWKPGDKGILTEAGVAGFAGTSGAAAVVAGVAGFLQGAAHARGADPLSPAELRALLRDPAMTTPTERDDRVGGMPDLWRLVEAVRQRPALKIPDIAPAIAGESPPRAPSTGGTPAIDAEEDHEVYAWVRNRGTEHVDDVRVDVYWAPVSPLSTPAAWTALGTASVPTVPRGGEPVRSEPVAWPAAAIPYTGHYTLIAVARTACLPPPCLPDADRFDWGAWVHHVDRQDAVASRTQHAVPAAAGSCVRLPFEVHGVPDRSLAFAIRVEGELPAGSRVELHHGGRMIGRRQFGDRAGVVRRSGVVDVREHCTLGPSRIPAGARWPMALVVHLAPGAPVRSEISVLQCRGDREVGRVGWTLSEEH